MTDKRSNVTPIRVTEGRLEKEIHKAAKAGRVQWVDPPSRDSMLGEVNYRSVIMCLKEGELSEKPVRDEHGNWQFFMHRHSSAGYTLCVHGAALCASTRIESVVVLSFAKEQ